ncbi:MAG: adenosylhomocysteinase [Methanomassiliicoccales archaeon]|nr:MAG: adenosylhomocysteinase [Methanomassiliicoccales archaeon]
MDDELRAKGKRRLEWAETHMRVMKEIGNRMVQEQTLTGVKVGMALHVEAKTGMLAVWLARAGAEVRLASCNPLSTDDSVATSLREDYGVKVYAKKWESTEEYYANLGAVLDMRPDYVVDDGADLITLLHTTRRDLLANVKGGNEETTTGVIRLRAMAKEGRLCFPVISVNDAQMKHLFDNRYGTGQSTFDGWMNATNLLVAGKTLVVAGYGWCGRGIAMRAKGLGANVIVTEVDPVRAIEARMDGHQVMPMMEAASRADIIISATGCKDIIRKEHLEVIKDGCVMGNSGHFDNEISKVALAEAASRPRKVREFVDEYVLRDGRKVYLIAEGRLMNLAAGQGHPVEIMDMSFAIQALCLEHLVKEHPRLENKVYDVPREIDEEVAHLALRSLGSKIDVLTPGQRKYLEEWKEGT